MRMFITLAAALLLFAAPAHAAKKMIRVSHTQQPTMESEAHFPAWVFQQYINQHSDTLEVSLHPASSLGSEREVYEAMQLGGGATCVISGTAILTNFAKKISVVDTPFLWKDYDHIHRVFDGKVGKELAKELEGIGLYVAAWMDNWGYRNVLTKAVVKTLDDLKGKKIRTIQSPVYLEAINALGATAVPMAFGEIYAAMQTGVIDGLEHSAVYVLNSKFYEVGKYYTMTEHLYGPAVWACSSKFMDGLTPEERATFDVAVQLGLDVNRGMGPVIIDRAMQKLEDQGVQIVKVDTTELRAKGEPIQDKIAGSVGGEDLLQEIRRLRDAAE